MMRRRCREFCLSWGWRAFVTGILTWVLSSTALAQSLNTSAASFPEGERFRHLLISRITFGNTPELERQVKALGNEAFLKQQLQPNLLTDPVLSKNHSPKRLRVFQAFVLEQMATNPNQLNEVMTFFWDNHFNTYFHKFYLSPEFELKENLGFRRHALGRFRDLLEVSAKSPSMLEYLDNRHNRKGNVGENYARELLELHTMGVDGGYSQWDVEYVAEILTGWTFNKQGFVFMPERHTGGFKRFQGKIIRAGLGEQGVLEGEELLDILAAHPATARHLCSKLLVLFLGSGFSATSIDACSDAFLAASESPDQIAQVVGHILRSDAFRAQLGEDSAIFTTPLRYVVKLARGLEFDRFVWLNGWLSDLGMPLFELGVPTGFAEDGDDWLSPAGQIQRMRFAAALSDQDQLRKTKPGSANLSLLAPFGSDSKYFQVRLQELASATGADRQALLAALLVTPDVQLR